MKRHAVRAFLAGLLVFGALGTALAQPNLPQPGLVGPAPSAVTAPAPAAPMPAMNAPATVSAVASANSAVTGTEDDYHLGSGDKVSMSVYGEDDLKAEMTVDGSGQVQLPLVGPMTAAGMSVREFAKAVATKLAQGDYLKNPMVSIQVLNYRPFYIIGEVNKPGEFPYEANLNVLGAVALAGGYTYRANDSTVYVRHKGEGKEEKLPADGSTKIKPGDIVRVAERIF